MAYAISGLDRPLSAPALRRTQAASDTAEDEKFCADMESVLPSLRAYARALCGSRDRADDTVQDALLKAWAARATYRQGTNFKAWIFTIMRNAFLSSVRRRKFEGEYHDGAEERLPAPPNQLDHLAILELRAALGQLPQQQRDTLMLVVIGGFSYVEAAKICGCMVGTVKSRVGRARAALQHMLEGDAVPPPGA